MLDGNFFLSFFLSFLSFLASMLYIYFSCTSKKARVVTILVNATALGSLIRPQAVLVQ